jgi:hypothetical protein
LTKGDVDCNKAIADITKQWSETKNENATLKLHILTLNWTTHRLKDIIVEVGKLDVQQIPDHSAATLGDELAFFENLAEMKDQLKSNIENAKNTLLLEVANKHQANPVTMEPISWWADHSTDPMFQSTNPSKKRLFASTNTNEQTKTTSQPAKNVSYYY